MIFADKLIQLRKKSGWTQEELAQQMHVSRQSVSKWEGAQSVPDLEKMVQLSRLFHVTTDYLLKDEEGEPEPAPGEDMGEPLRRVSLEEASAFLEAKQRSAGPIAFATMLCVLSPIGLILRGAEVRYSGKCGGGHRHDPAAAPGCGGNCHVHPQRQPHLLLRIPGEGTL